MPGNASQGTGAQLSFSPVGVTSKPPSSPAAAACRAHIKYTKRGSPGTFTRVDAAMAGALWAEGYIFLRKVDHETIFETGWNQPGQLPGPQPE